MGPFIYERATSPSAAIAAGLRVTDNALRPRAEYLAGGTTLLDLMKLNVMRPELVIDINHLGDTPYGRIAVTADGLRLGALVRMADAADHRQIQQQYPVIAQALQLAASPQLRNMATLGGNVLQRTRCTYFRDVSYAACNKRNPGSGCAAMAGFNRSHAVLGVSEDCIATYAGDFAQALIALDAAVEIAGPAGLRTMPFAALHRKPGNTPDQETSLQPGDLIVSFTVPAAPWTSRSLYLKVRDRQSYEFALASAAVALEQEKGVVRQVRIALGGVATVPWRAREAETVLLGKPLDDRSLAATADAAFAGAESHEHNSFKVTLGKQTLIRALRQAAALEI